MTVGRGSPAAQVRLPDELKAWLQHEAIDNRRSLNSEIVVRLEQSRAQQLAQEPKGAQQ
ncbi:MAG: Arc family DNA-binding protein [Diaphorobacter nitroreducens]|uniref:Arc family DNA-binding protein n=1 Tax=Diaphorobacter nitroreducens TaxID=164759 RepID=UPI003C725928